MTLKYLSSEYLPEAGITTVYELGENYLVSAEDNTLTPEDNRFTVMLWSKSDIDLLEGSKWDWDKGHSHMHRDAWFFQTAEDRDNKLIELQNVTV